MFLSQMTVVVKAPWKFGCKMWLTQCRWVVGGDIRAFVKHFPSCQYCVAVLYSCAKAII